MLILKKQQVYRGACCFKIQPPAAKGGNIVAITKIEEEILKNIIAAQISSDSGKGINYLMNDAEKNKLFIKAYKRGYSGKTEYIANAIALINGTRLGAVNYYTEARKDQNGYASYVTYFDIKLHGNRYQVSFHSPANLAEDIKASANKGRRTHWRKNHESSREVCEMLLKEFFSA